MSASSLLLDGALRATQLVPLLFAFNAAQPAGAQLPRPLQASLATPAGMPAAQVASPDTLPAPVVLGDAGSAAPLTLRASHVDIRIAGRSAHVRTTLSYRNDGTVPVEALYTVPLPATLAKLRPADGVEASGCDEADDLPAELAQFLEAGEPLPVYERGSVRVAPGEEVTVTLGRTTDLIVRGDRHRFVLPLVTQRGGVFTPQFSAEVTIDADRPLRELASATHPVEVSGIGDRHARLTVPSGRAYEGQFLAFDYALADASDAAIAPAAVTAAPPVDWGGEARPRRAAVDLAAR